MTNNHDNTCSTDAENATSSRSNVTKVVNLVHLIFTCCFFVFITVFDIKDSEFFKLKDNKILHHVLYVLLGSLWQVCYTGAMQLVANAPRNKRALVSAIVLVCFASVHTCILCWSVTKKLWFCVYVGVVGLVSAAWTIFLMYVALAKPAYAAKVLPALSGCDAHASVDGQPECCQSGAGDAAAASKV